MNVKKANCLVCGGSGHLENWDCYACFQDAEDRYKERYSAADVDALCAIAVAAIKKSFDLCSDCPPLYWTTDKTRCESCPRTAMRRRK